MKIGVGQIPRGILPQFFVEIDLLQPWQRNKRSQVMVPYRTEPNPFEIGKRLDSLQAIKRGFANNQLLKARDSREGFYGSDP